MKVTDEMVEKAEFAGDDKCSILGLDCPPTSVYRAALEAALAVEHPDTVKDEVTGPERDPIDDATQEVAAFSRAMMQGAVA